jgi:hypothetical protein
VAHLYETGGLRRAHVRGHENVLKRLLVYAGAFNLGLWIRTLFGVGTPRSLQGRVVAFGATIAALWALIDDGSQRSGGNIAITHDQSIERSEFSSPGRSRENRDLYHGMLRAFVQLPLAA